MNYAEIAAAVVAELEASGNPLAEPVAELFIREKDIEVVTACLTRALRIAGQVRAALFGPPEPEPVWPGDIVQVVTPGNALSGAPVMVEGVMGWGYHVRVTDGLRGRCRLADVVRIGPAAMMPGEIAEARRSAMGEGR